MNKTILGKVEKELTTVNSEIVKLKDEFWDMSEWNDEKAELQAKIEANQEWKIKLEMSKETIVVMSNGGIAANIRTKVDNHKESIYEGVDLTRSERPAGRIRFVS